MGVDVPLPTLEPAGFQHWYDTTFPQVFGYAMKFTGGDRELAENVTQETFIAAIRRMRTGGEEPIPVGWLVTVARNKVIDEVRRRDRFDSKVLKLRSERMPMDEPFTPDQSQHILQSLPALERSALALRYLDDLPVQQVAEALGKSVRATESLLARARRRVRSQFAELKGDDQ